MKCRGRYAVYEFPHKLPMRAPTICKTWLHSRLLALWWKATNPRAQIRVRDARGGKDWVL